MNDLYPSGSILVLFFSGVSGSAFLSNGGDNIPVKFKDDKGYVQIHKPLSKQELITNYMLLKTDGHYMTKYRLFC